MCKLNLKETSEPLLPSYGVCPAEQVQTGKVCHCPNESELSAKTLGVTSHLHPRQCGLCKTFDIWRCFSDAQRYSVFTCRFVGVENSRPVGCLANARAFEDAAYAAWLSLKRPRTCPCSSQHAKMIGTTGGQVFNSSLPIARS